MRALISKLQTKIQTLLKKQDFSKELERLPTDLSKEEIKSRFDNWQKPEARYTRGVLAKYAATVTSASILNEDQQADLLKKIQSVAGTDNLELNLKVDPDLIGGFVVSVGSKVIDASLAGQVRRLGLALAKVS